MSAVLSVLLGSSIQIIFPSGQGRAETRLPTVQRKRPGLPVVFDLTARLKSHGKWDSLSLKGIGRLRFKGQIAGNVLKARIVKTPLRIVVQLVVALPDAQPHPRPPLGSDVGVAARVTLSDGQRWTKHEVDRERLTVLQQRLSAAKKGSKNRQKRKRMLAKEWQRVRERERAILHEMTAELVKSKSNCYYVENLDVQEMMGNYHLARAITEQQWSTLVNMLPYKAASAGGWVVQVDPRYTSQDCSRCGTRGGKTLSDRLHECPAGGLSIDRDWNAAINILHRGLTVSPPSGGKTPSGTPGAENGMLCDQSISFPYLTTVRGNSDGLDNRRKREQILSGVLESLFQKRTRSVTSV